MVRLVSDAARSVTGVTLPVDAGFVNKRVDSWIPQSVLRLAHDDRCERDELAGVAGVRRPV